MDAQIENAIEIAWNPTSDQALKGQAFQFLTDLRTDPQGWQACASLFTRTPKPSEVVRLVCLEIVNNAIVVDLDVSRLAILKDTLLDYIRRNYGSNDQSQVDPFSLQNKLTQTLTFLFARLYKEGWESFIDDFLALTSLPGSGQKDNAVGCFLYLRILSSVHDEIADLMLSRQPEEAKRNTDLKDLIRGRDMEKIARSWQDILAQYQTQNDAIVEMTLKVIGKWVSWVDISLVIHQDMLNLLLPLVGRANTTGSDDKVRDAAIDAFTEIVGKKMKPTDKMDLISFLELHNIVSQLIASPPLNEFKGTPKYDTDLAEAVAKLVNTVVTDIVKALDLWDRSSPSRADQHLHDFVPLLLHFFSDEYDEVCSTVIPSLTDILTYFRRSPMTPQYSEMLPPILNAIIMKMRYDETSSWGNEDEQTDEAEFLELRKRLQNLQKSVAAVDQNLYMEILSNVVANTFQTLDQRGSQMDWRDLDLALHEMYLFGELALPNQGLTTKSQPSTEASERLLAIMSKMVESGIAEFPHPAILLQYMEICVRYCAFFESRQEYIPRVLENFVRLVHHEHLRVRMRSWYLFHRFVKHLRAQVGNVAETVIQSIGDLLPIKAEVPGDEADDDMSSDETDHSADALFTNQLYLFEAIGCISSTTGTPVEKQALYVRSVMDPLFSDMERNLARAKSGDNQAILQIHHIVMALGTLAHGFADWNQGINTQRAPPDKSVSDEFGRAAEAILIALKELNSNSEIRNACRSALSRLLGVLGATVLPQLPQWIEGLLSQSSSNDEMAMFLRLLEQIVYGFKGEIYEILNLLLTPLLQRIFTGLSQPITGTDDDIQLAELRREYLQFVQIIINNDLGGVLVSETNQGFFETLISSIISLARGITHGNLSTSRMAFSLLSKMTLVWGGPDIATVSNPPAAPTGSPSPLIPGFDQFVIQRFHPVCWEVLQDQQFKPADAQTRQVMTEIANLEQTIYMKTGEVFIQNLQSSLFPSLGIDGSEFLQRLTSDKKGFLNYLQKLVQERGR